MEKDAFGADQNVQLVTSTLAANRMDCRRRHIGPLPLVGREDCWL